MKLALMEDIGEGVVLPLVELLHVPGVEAWTGERTDSTTTGRTTVSCMSSGLCSKCTP